MSLDLATWNLCNNLHDSKCDQNVINQTKPIFSLYSLKMAFGVKEGVIMIFHLMQLEEKLSDSFWEIRQNMQNCLFLGYRPIGRNLMSWLCVRRPSVRPSVRSALYLRNGVMNFSEILGNDYMGYFPRTYFSFRGLNHFWPFYNHFLVKNGHFRT